MITNTSQETVVPRMLTFEYNGGSHPGEYRTVLALEETKNYIKGIDVDLPRHDNFRCFKQDNIGSVHEHKVFSVNDDYWTLNDYIYVHKNEESGDQVAYAYEYVEDERGKMPPKSKQTQSVYLSMKPGNRILIGRGDKRVVLNFDKAEALLLHDNQDNTKISHWQVQGLLNWLANDNQ